MNKYDNIAKKIQEADAILIGASNGLSITEGLHLFADDAAFEALFHDYKIKYGFHRILDGFFFEWKDPAEKWDFLSRLISHYSGTYEGSPVMSDIKAIIGDKPYFIVTSNGEGHFALAGFDPERIYELEGNWLEMRCGRLCQQKTYPVLPDVRKMAAEEQNGVIPQELIPRCPVCGSVMELYTAQPPKEKVVEEWQNFRRNFHQKKLVILELGIGWRNQLIKEPLMRMMADEPFAAYITINLGEVYIPEKIENKSYGLDGYLSEQLQYIKEAIEKRSSADDGKSCI